MLCSIAGTRDGVSHPSTSGYAVACSPKAVLGNVNRPSRDLTGKIHSANDSSLFLIPLNVISENIYNAHLWSICILLDVVISLSVSDRL